MRQISGLGTIRAQGIFALLFCAGRLAASSYDFTQIDVPGACLSEAAAINNAGQIAGVYAICNVATNGFVKTGGTFSTIEVPGALSTEVSGINNLGQISGVYTQPGSTNQQGFLATRGVLTTIDVPGAVDTHVSGLNDKGQVVGFSTDSAGAEHSFVYANGTFTRLNVPATIELNGMSYAFGINNAGQIVGYSYYGLGFLYSNGIFTALDKPGAQWTFPLGINNLGQIVGEYSTGYSNTDFHGFVYAAGTFSDITVPGGTVTTVSGINDEGQIVGIFYDAASQQHGFLLTPTPEPATFALFAIGGIGSGVVFCCRQSSKHRQRADLC